MDFVKELMTKAVDTLKWIKEAVANLLEFRDTREDKPLYFDLLPPELLALWSKMNPTHLVSFPINLSTVSYKSQ